MQRQTVVRRSAVLLGLLGSLGLAAALLNTGCLKIGGNQPLLKIEDRSEPPPVDTSRVQVTSIEDARQQIAQAHSRIQYLEQENARLRRDREELRADLKRVRSERDNYKDRYEKATGRDD